MGLSQTSDQVTDFFFKILGMAECSDCQDLTSCFIGLFLNLDCHINSKLTLGQKLIYVSELSTKILELLLWR